VRRPRRRAANDYNGYITLPVRLTQVGNLEACFITGIKRVLYGGLNNWSAAWACIDNELTHASEGGHNVAAVLLYRANAGITVDDTASWYIRQVEGAITGGPMLSNEACLLCHEKAYVVLWRTCWRWWAKPLLAAPVRGALPYAGGNCSARIPFNVWEPH
jgi:hypothetical protein